MYIVLAATERHRDTFLALEETEDLTSREFSRDLVIVLVRSKRFPFADLQLGSSDDIGC